MNKTDIPELAAPGTAVQESAEIDLEVHKMHLSNQVGAGETTRDQKAATSRKVRAAQWALGLGVRGCRKACKAFYKKKQEVHLSPKDSGKVMPGAFIQTPVWSGVQDTKMDTNTDAHVSKKIDLIGADNFQTNKSCEQKPGRSRGFEGGVTMEVESENVWTQIAADIDKGGIPIDWIKKRRDVIAQCVIENLGQEIEQEREKELRLKNKKEARMTKRVRQPTRKTSRNHEGVRSSYQKPSVESNKSNSTNVVVGENKQTLTEVIEMSKAEKSETTNQSNFPILAEVTSTVIEGKKPALAKPEPEHATVPESSTTALGRDHSVGDDSNLLRPDNDKKGSSKFRVGNADSNSASGQAGENDRLATERNRDAHSQPWNLDDPFYRAIDTANKYAMATLLKIRELGATDETSLGSLSLVADNVEEDSVSETYSSASPSTSVFAVESPGLTVQPKTSVMSGRWYETPRGSLKRLDDEDVMSGSLSDAEQSSGFSKSSSEESGGTSKTSIATHGFDDIAGSSNGHLLSPETSQSQKINGFQVPNVGGDNGDDDGNDDGDDDGDDDQDSDDGGVKLEHLTQNNNREPSNESERSNLYEEGLSLVNEGSENTGDEEQENREPMVTVDYGAFNMAEVCVALGSGNLDEARMEKLKDMFHILLAEVLGRI